MFFLPLILSVIVLTHSLLVLTGKFKGPVLQHLALADETHPYHPILHTIFWSIVFINSIQLLYWFYSSQYQFYTSDVGLQISPLNVLIALPLLSPLLSPGRWIRHYPQLAKLSRSLQRYPTWYDDLCEITSPHERRRLTELWALLPRAMRWRFNVNDLAFSDWADQVILGSGGNCTITETVIETEINAAPEVLPTVEIPVGSTNSFSQN